MNIYGDILKLASVFYSTAHDFSDLGLNPTEDESEKLQNLDNFLDILEEEGPKTSRIHKSDEDRYLLNNEDDSSFNFEDSSFGPSTTRIPGRDYMSDMMNADDFGDLEEFDELADDIDSREQSIKDYIPASARAKLMEALQKSNPEWQEKQRQKREDDRYEDNIKWWNEQQTPEARKRFHESLNDTYKLLGREPSKIDSTSTDLEDFDI